MTITDERMLKVSEYVIENKVKNITSMTAWCEAIGFTHNNINNVKKGTQSFRIEHVIQCCKVFNIDANYLMGISNKMNRNEPAKLLDRFKAIIPELEAAIAKK